MVTTTGSQPVGEGSIPPSFTNVMPSLCELDAPLGIRGKAPVCVALHLYKMTRCQVPTWLDLKGSWDKAQVCWKHLLYCGWVRCPPEPHKLRLPSSSLRIRIHMPEAPMRIKVSYTMSAWFDSKFWFQCTEWVVLSKYPSFLSRAVGDR